MSLLGVFSCVFDDTDDASAWMRESGYPASTKIDVVRISGVRPDSVWLVRDTVPYVNSGTLSLGEGNGMRQELLLDLLTHDVDSSAIDWLQDGDSAWISLRLTLDSAFYAEMPQGDSLPFQEGLTVRFAWKLHSAMDEDRTDSLVLSDEDMDSLVRKVVAGTEVWDTASIPVTLNLEKKNSSFSLVLPDSLQKAFRAAKKGDFYLQMRMRFERADRIYRIAGLNSRSSARPRLQFKRRMDDSSETYSGLKDSLGFYARYFQIGYTIENSASNILLHGGVPESLYVDFPEEVVWEAVKAQLQDSMLLRPDQIDSLLTSRFVLLASMDVQSDMSKIPSELGIPLLVYSYSVVDTVDAVELIGFTEEYNTDYEPRTMIDSLNIKSSGRSNTLFWSGRDTLQLQITNAVRYWLQSRYYGVRLRAKMNISSWPIREPKRFNTADYYDSDSTLVNVVSDFPAYSRWDLGTPESMSFGIRIWLTEKR